MKRLIYFERLRLRHLPLVVAGLLLGAELRAFDRDLTLKRNPIWRWLIRRGSLHRCYPYAMKGDDRAAIDTADALVDAGEGASTVAALVALYRSGEASLIVKRALAEHLSLTYAIAGWFRWRAADHANARVWLVAEEYAAHGRLLARHGLTPPALPDWVRLRTPGLLASSGLLLHRLATYAALSARHMACIALQHLPLRRERPGIAAYRYCFALSAAFQLKFTGPRRFSFALDGVHVSRDETLFLLELPAPGNLTARPDCDGLHIADVSRAHTLRTFSRKDLRGPWQQELVRAVFRSGQYCWRKPFTLAATRTALAEFLRWNVVLAQFRFSKYLFSNKEFKNQIAGNILLRNAGIESWNYSRFIGGPYMLAVPHCPFDDRNVHWSFLNSDVSVVNTPAMARSFAAHRQHVRRYEVIGSMFGDMIRDNSVAGKRDALRARLLAAPPATEGRVIAIFDTSYIDDPLVFTNFDDAIAFCHDMLVLAERRPQDRFIFKPSKADGYFVDPSEVWSSPEKGAEVVRLRNALRQRPNVTWVGDAADTTEVSAAADLTITHCFSSTTADALAAGKPAIWYEPGEKLRGYPLDAVPGAVAHGFAELLQRIDGYLPPGRPPIAPPVSPESRDLVDPFADGKSLQRFRELVAGGALSASAAMAVA